MCQEISSTIQLYFINTVIIKGVHEILLNLVIMQFLEM